MTPSRDSGSAPVGMRERKRVETIRRITDAGVRLFTERGYESTTLEAIAAEAGISRRTFFHYFKSKDDILLSLQKGLGERVAEALARQPAQQGPLDATRRAIMEVVAPFTSEALIALDRLMRSSEAVQARKQASYIQDEALLFSALRNRWPAENEMDLRLVAMLAIGASRLSVDAWSKEGGKRPLGEFLKETFDALATVCRRYSRDT